MKRIARQPPEEAVVMPASAEGLDGPPYYIRAVQRVCDILDLLQDAPAGVALPDVADVTGLPKSSAFRARPAER